MAAASARVLATVFLPAGGAAVGGGAPLPLPLVLGAPGAMVGVEGGALAAPAQC